MHTVPAQTWWVTGASAGIGYELARLLASAGHRVYATARRRDALEALANDYPDRIVALPCDVADADAMARLFAGTGAPARLDGVILSAGICEYQDVCSLDAVSARRVLEVNFHGAFNACQAALPLLRAAAAAGSRPQLVGIGSLAAAAGFPRAEAYGASKAAVHYLLNSLRCDVGHLVDVTTVMPGFVATRLTAANDFPMPWLWTAEHAATHIMARLGQGRRRILFPWQLRLMLGLARLMPALWYAHWAARARRREAA